MPDLCFFLKLYRRHWGMLTLGVLLAIVTLLAGLGLLAVSGWFITASSIAGLTVMSAEVFNFFTPGATVRGFSILRTASRYFERLVSHDATFRLLAWLREWFFSKLMPLSLSRINRYRKGDLLNRLVADVDALDQLYLRLLSPLFSAVITSLLLSGFISWFSLSLGVFALLVMMLWIVLMPLLFYVVGRRTGESLGNALKELRQQVLDHLQGMAEGLIYGGNKKNTGKLKRTELAMHHEQLTMAWLDGLGSFLFIVGAGCAAIVMLWLASGEFQLQNISAPVMVMTVFVILAGFEVLMPLPGAFQFLSRTRQAAARLKEVIDEKPIIFGDGEGCSSVRGRIQFKGVDFYYNDGLSDEHNVISNLCLDIASGEHIALLGRTGCGKSTLTRLLSRGLDLVNGDILLDGRRLESLTEKMLYQAITIIPQRTHVFSDTLRGNLLLADPKSDDCSLVQVIDKVGLNNLGGGAYNTAADLLNVWVGQGGVSLSGGEQRRLAAARALLKPAPILIMDEATEGLDRESEQELLRVILDDFKNSTVVMITHKNLMLERMDAMYRMNAGRIETILIGDM
ncbi:MAG: cysteine/glutathione ABC transporter ATP-binding protein/permease CydC [Candidatus Endonucleobacter sp. (ex Gigantidas childressi)]|nr:cysteine/glutathione ABC transporter ATP-binding protein/permease CydC [Candidatus Endonucleobacter sp. (ex Gigantidas childressi)]